ncbi:type I polyketide synthase AVES 4 [Diaporthe helianthi]|uniref:Type I polyketide synthase AVES 4 n=1 Tax=Diaporthe helianthi TaxID=158607 RepID=A0A2P5HZB9_DIAHE|nr:type I polyketide synthase AVES 4 [Diaporthe helianthi]
MGCRLPGGLDSPSRLWEELKSPRELARRIPSDRWSVDKYYHPVGTHHGTTNVTELYFLDDDLSRFDAPFFSIGAAKAEAMDPQHRLLLEVVYEAIEAGGYSLDRVQGSDTAVYVGMMCTDYYAIALQEAS